MNADIYLNDLLPNPPQPPANFEVSGDYGDNPYMTWDANTESDLVGYNIYREFGNTIDKLNNDPVQATNFTDSDMTVGPLVDVDYWATAVDVTQLESAESNRGSIMVYGFPKDNVSTMLPEKYQIHQNFPNPFNPVTSINYAVPKRSRVSIIINDINGREVGNTSYMSKEPGFYTYRWNAVGKGVNISSGMYFLTINMKSLVDEDKYYKTIKMLYVR